MGFPLEIVDEPTHRRPRPPKGRLREFADRIGWVRVLIGAIVALGGGAAASAAYLGRLATKADVAAEVRAATAPLASARDDHERRLRVVEQHQAEDRATWSAHLHWIEDALRALAERQRVPVSPPPPRREP